MDKPTSYFRYNEVLRGEGYTDEWGDYIFTGSRVEIQLQEYQVVKHTPCGVRINNYTRNGRFISKDWHKQWACPTIEEARKSFIARKKRQASIYEARQRTTKTAQHMAEAGKLPSAVQWGPNSKPNWARGTDETAKVAKHDAKLLEHKQLLDYVNG